jgi:GTP cyclohydrolase I
MQDLIRQLLAELGEDPGREGLHNTPKRVEKALKFLTSGYDANLNTIERRAVQRRYSECHRRDIASTACAMTTRCPSASATWRIPRTR